MQPQTVARQAPLSMGFFRHEYWSGLPVPPSGNLPDPGIEPVSLTSPELAGGFFTTSAMFVLFTTKQNYTDHCDFEGQDLENIYPFLTHRQRF